MAITEVQSGFASRLANGESTWEDGAFSSLLLDSSVISGGISTDWDTLNEILSVFTDAEVASAGYARQPVTGTALVDDPPDARTLYQSDPLDFGSPANDGDSYDTLVIFFDLGDDNLSWVAGVFDISDSGSPRLTDGNPIVINSSADGWFALACNP